MSTLKPPTLRVDLKLCTGCRSCTIACALSHEHQLAFQTARIRVEKNFPGMKTPIFKPVFCRMCRNAKCIVACPTGVLTEDPATGLVNLDARLCNGCGECVPACPFDAIWLDANRGVAIKCDLCGGDPACVRSCAPGALVFEGVKTQLQKDK